MTPQAIHRHRYRLAAHRPETRTQARHRRLLGRTHQPIGPGIRRRDIAPRHVVGPGRRRPGLGAGEHLLLLRPDARHRGHARRAAGPGRRGLRRPGPLLRRRARQQGCRAAGNDQVVRHQLPLHRSRDRARDQVLAEPGQGALRAERGPRARNSRAPGRHRAGHLPAAEQGRQRRRRADRAAAGAGADLLRAAVAARRQRRAVGAVRRARAGHRHLPRRARAGRGRVQRAGQGEQPARHLRRHLLR